MLIRNFYLLEQSEKKRSSLLRVLSPAAEQNGNIGLPLFMHVSGYYVHDIS